MKQVTFASMAFGEKKRQTRREKFLGEMEAVVPWSELVGIIEPYSPKAGHRGRQPMVLATMLRIYFVRQGYALLDPGMEDALYEIESIRRFVGLELGDDAIPDETTILKFRHLVGETRFDGADEGRDQRDVEGAWVAVGGRDDGGCDDHSRGEFDEEPGEAAGPGDALDEERESVVLRDEDSCGGGREFGAGTYGIGDVRQCLGHQSDAGVVAGRRPGGIGRPGLRQ